MKRDIYFQDDVLIAMVESPATSLRLDSIFQLLGIDEDAGERRKLGYHLALLEDQNLVHVSKDGALDEYRVTASGQAHYEWLQKNISNRPGKTS
jgi:predicted transcriptional regulator